MFLIFGIVFLLLFIFHLTRKGPAWELYIVIDIVAVAVCSYFYLI